VASRVVLDSQGAEQLPAIKGRAILQMADRRETVQTYLINNEVINQVVSPYITNESKREGVTNEEILDGETGADTFVIEETYFSE
jgi:S-DNA-T family DNA segregation ATPase FtsK/SpoIIIE